MKDYAETTQRARSRRPVGSEVLRDLLPACLLIVGGMAFGLTAGLGLRAAEADSVTGANAYVTHLDVSRWRTSGCDTDMDCTRLSDFMTRHCPADAMEDSGDCALFDDWFNRPADLIGEAP